MQATRAEELAGSEGRGVSQAPRAEDSANQGGGRRRQRSEGRAVRQAPRAEEDDDMRDLNSSGPEEEENVFTAAVNRRQAPRAEELASHRGPRRQAGTEARGVRQAPRVEEEENVFMSPVHHSRGSPHIGMTAAPDILRLGNARSRQLSRRQGRSSTEPEGRATAEGEGRRTLPNSLAPHLAEVSAAQALREVGRRRKRHRSGFAPLASIEVPARDIDESSGKCCVFVYSCFLVFL